MPQSGAFPLDLRSDTTGVLVEPPSRSRRSGPPPIPTTVPKGKSNRSRRPSTEQRSSVTRVQPAKVRKVKTGRRVSIAWFLVLLMLGAGGLGGFYLFEQWQTSVDELNDARRELAGANERAAAADRRALAVQTELTRTQGDLDRLGKELDGASKRAEQADELADKLQSIVGEQGTVTRENEKLTLEMVDKVLFRSGEAALTEKGEEVLASVGEELKKFPEKQIWVQGHTDDVPIANDLFASNWELSAARALTVVHYLEDVAGVDPRRLAAVGFGEHRPVSRSKRFRNRRIEIVLFPRDVRLIKD